MAAIKLKESDLYLPIKAHLSKQGFEVKGEIKNCDIVAKKDDQTIIIELKLSLNITLLLQAVDRFNLSDTVYIAIPKQCNIYKKQTKQVKKLIKRLGIGLIIVDCQEDQQYVEIVSDPQDYTPRINKRKQTGLLKEFNQRIGDTQKGGSTKALPSLTAYRQRSIRVAKYLLTCKQATGLTIKNEINEPQASLFLSKDYYGWFERVSRGVYKLSSKGVNELPKWLETSQKHEQN